MKLVRLTPENVKNYIGRNIIFTSRGEKCMKKIVSASASGNSIKIEHPDLNNCLQIVSRKIYIIS